MKTVKIMIPLIVIGSLTGCAGPAVVSYGYNDDVYYEPFYNDSVYFQPSYYSPLVIGGYGYRQGYYHGYNSGYYHGGGYNRGGGYYHGGGGYRRR